MARSNALSLDLLQVLTGDLPPAFKTAETRSTAAIEVARTIAELRALEQEWTRLHEASSNHNPFLSFDWTLACWTSKDHPAELFVATVRDQSRILALAPLCIETRAGVKILRFIADERSDYLGFLTAAGSPEMEQWLLEQLTCVEGEWDVVLLEKLTPSYSSLLETVRAPRYEWHKTRWTSAPYCLWDGEWDSFHKEGPVWLKEARRRTRRFLSEGYRVESFSGAEAAKRVPLVSAIEVRSWKGRKGSTRLQPGPGADLLRRAFETLGSRDQMELWLAFAGDRAIAFHIYFVLQDRLWDYHTAYDEEFGYTRAGSVAAYLAIESAWKRGIREFDYLCGDEPYKLERSNAARAIYHLAGHPMTPKGWLAYHLLIAPRWHLRNVPLLKAMHERGRSLLRKRGRRNNG